ncbi:hypothetical protein, partial [Facilibium subflavum]|uniref:hypothetical protein n=1 Tax=Facilibium subflavum TaxID=2219058 RepID=UPI0013C2F219
KPITRLLTNAVAKLCKTIQGSSTFHYLGKRAKFLEAFSDYDAESVCDWVKSEGFEKLKKLNQSKTETSVLHEQLRKDSPALQGMHKCAALLDILVEDFPVDVLQKCFNSMEPLELYAFLQALNKGFSESEVETQLNLLACCIADFFNDEAIQNKMVIEELNTFLQIHGLDIQNIQGIQDMESTDNKRLVIQAFLQFIKDIQDIKSIDKKQFIIQA